MDWFTCMISKTKHLVIFYIGNSKNLERCLYNYFFCRESLPIYNFEQEIIQAIDQHKVTIISGETGSGLFANFFGICLHFLICIHTLSTICLQFFHRKNNSSPTIFTWTCEIHSNSCENHLHRTSENRCCFNGRKSFRGMWNPSEFCLFIFSEKTLKKTRENKYRSLSRNF